MLVRKTFLELDVELAAGFQQHCDTQQHISLLVHNQCLISHEDGEALAFNSGHWKSYIRALSVDSVTSDVFQQDGLPFAACASAHVQMRGCVDGAVTDAALVKNR